MAYQFCVQGLENILWSFATLNYSPSEKLLTTTADFMERNLELYNQQNLALTLWAYAKLSFKVFELHVSILCPDPFVLFGTM